MSVYSMCVCVCVKWRKGRHEDNVPLSSFGLFLIWTSTLAGFSQQARGEIDIHPTERLIIVHLALHRALFSHSSLLFNQTQEVKSRLREGAQKRCQMRR